MFDFLMYGFQKNAVFVLSKNKVPPKKKLLKYKKNRSEATERDSGKPFPVPHRGCHEVTRGSAYYK